MASTSPIKRRDIGPIPETTLAWLAAVIDCEGALMLIRKKTNNGRPSFRARGSVANTDIRLMEALEDKTGIRRCGQRRRQPGLGHKDYYVWTMEAVDLRQWLPILLPWLVCKRRQAELLIEYLHEAEQNIAVQGEKFDPRPRTRKIEIAAEIKLLNKRGIPKEVVPI